MALPSEREALKFIDILFCITARRQIELRKLSLKCKASIVSGGRRDEVAF
jgi:hypothetical protein